MNDMLGVNATQQEREQFRVSALEARVIELEAIVAALLQGKVSDDEVSAWRDAVVKLTTDFTPHLAMIRGRGERMAKQIKGK